MRKMVRMNVKTGALISAAGTVISTIGSFWIASVSIRSITSVHPSWKWWITPLFALALLDGILPLFYWSLYRFEGRFKFPKSSRTTALLVACAMGVVLCLEALDLAKSRTFPTAPACLSLVGELCCALLLFCISQYRIEEDQAPQPKSGVFFIVTKVAALWGALWIAIGCLQVVATPFVFAVDRHVASGYGRPTPQFAHILVPSMERLVSVLCLWITPWLVYTISRRTGTAESMVTESAVPSRPDTV